jgi:hypothetical protein
MRVWSPRGRRRRRRRRRRRALVFSHLLDERVHARLLPRGDQQLVRHLDGTHGARRAVRRRGHGCPDGRVGVLCVCVSRHRCSWKKKRSVRVSKWRRRASLGLEKVMMMVRVFESKVKRVRRAPGRARAEQLAGGATSPGRQRRRFRKTVDGAASPSPSRPALRTDPQTRYSSTSRPSLCFIALARCAAPHSLRTTRARDSSHRRARLANTTHARASDREQPSER